MEYDKFITAIKQKIIKALKIPEHYLTEKQNIPVPHCGNGDLFYCDKKDSEYYQYYIYIIGDAPSFEGTGYEYFMVKDEIVIKSSGAPRHVDDSIVDGLITPVYDISKKAKILLLINGIFI